MQKAVLIDFVTSWERTHAELCAVQSKVAKLSAWIVGSIEVQGDCDTAMSDQLRALRACWLVGNGIAQQTPQGQ